MKHLADPLERLFRAAAQAPEQTTEEMRPGFDTRVLAARRLEREEPLPWSRLLRGALACSTVILVLSLAAGYRFFQADQDELSLAETVIRTSFTP